MEKLDVYEANYQFVRTANEPQYASGAVHPFTAATAYLDTPASELPCLYQTEYCW